MTIPTNAYPMHAMCVMCGNNWGQHVLDACPAPNRGKFMLDIGHPANAGIPVYNPNPSGFTAPAPVGLIRPTKDICVYGFTGHGRWMTWTVFAPDWQTAVHLIVTGDPTRCTVAYSELDLNHVVHRPPASTLCFAVDVVTLINKGQYTMRSAADAWASVMHWLATQPPGIAAAVQAQLPATATAAPSPTGRIGTEQSPTYQALPPSIEPQARPVGPRKPPMTETVQDWLTRQTATSEGRQALMDRAWEATKALAKGA